MRLQWICLTIALSSLPAPAVAQRVPEPGVERHAKRFLALSNLAFVDTKEPTYTAGGLIQVSLKKWTVTRSTKPDSLLASVDGSMHSKLAVGRLDPAIRRALRGQFINVGNDATVSESNGIWVLVNGSDRYTFAMDSGKLGIYTAVSTQVIILPRFYLHLLGAGGINSDQDFAGQGQVGVIRRNASSTFTAFGLALQGTLPMRGIAPIVRLEILDVIGLQAGPAYYEGGEWGYFVSADVMKGLWEDIGF